MRLPAPLIAISLSLLLLPRTAFAGDICVICSGPEATYRCTADEGLGGPAPAVERVLKYVCAIELARQGGHEKCRARRQTSEPCIGSVKSVSLSAQPEALGQAGAEGELPIGDGRSEESEAPPRTMLELARRTADASGEQLKKAGEAVKGSANSAGEKLEKAGDAVGTAVKKSWRCLASLFKEC